MYVGCYNSGNNSLNSEVNRRRGMFIYVCMKLEDYTYTHTGSKYYHWCWLPLSTNPELDLVYGAEYDTPRGAGIFIDGDVGNGYNRDYSGSSLYIYHYYFDTDIARYLRLCGGVPNHNFESTSGLYCNYSGQDVDKESTRGSLAQYHTLNGDEDSPGVIIGGFSYIEGWSVYRIGLDIYAVNDYNNVGALAADSGSLHYNIFILSLGR